MRWFVTNLERLKKALYFLGRRTTGWLIVGIMAGALMGFSELGLSVLLQALLVSLDIIQNDSSVLGGPFVFLFSSPSLLLVALFLVIAVKGACVFLVGQSSIVAHELINARLRCVAIYDLLNSKSFVSASDVNAKVGDTFPRAAQFSQQASMGIPTLIQSTVLLIFMMIAAWREALVSFAMMAVIAFIVMKANQKVRKISSRIPGEQKALTRGIERVSRNWLLVKVLRTAPFEADRLVRSILNYSTHFTNSYLVANLASSLPIILGGVMLVTIVGLNIYFFETPGPVLLAFLYLLVRFTQQLASLAKTIGACSSFFEHFKLSAQYFFSFSPQQLSEALRPAQAWNGGRFRNAPVIEQVSTSVDALADQEEAPEIVITNLSFRYKENLPFVIENLSLVVPAGEQFGVIGRSGSGKSTLLALILGILEPTKGSILINGKKPQVYFAQKNIRVGYVGAEAFLIEGSIRENLEYGRNLTDSPSEEEYWDALRLARLEEIVRAKPGQLEFELLENGEGLSAGQKQRLGLARAFFAKPQVLILDEASANLDDSTEQEITKSIRQNSGKWTVIIVSHRAGILSHATSIYDFEAGTTINSRADSLAESI